MVYREGELEGLRVIGMVSWRTATSFSLKTRWKRSLALTMHSRRRHVQYQTEIERVAKARNLQQTCPL